MNWLRKRKWDFILAIGDDWIDEEMFSSLPRSAYTIRVGIAPSRAKYNISSYIEVRKLLRSLIETTMK